MSPWRPVLGVPACLVAVAAHAGAPADAPTDPHPDDAALAIEVTALMDEVAALRGLAFHAPVPVLLADPDAAAAALLAEDLDTDAQRELAILGRTLKVMRAAPDGFDARAGIEAVLRESLGGYYDLERRELVLVRRPGAFAGPRLDPDSDDRPVATHELTHALQDQALGLWALSQRDYNAGDAQFAVQALIEGDATHLMLRASMGEDAPKLDRLNTEALAAATMATQDSWTPALRALPRLLGDTLVLPYTAGTLFVHEVRRSGGSAAVDALYTHPPLSSEQVLHPARWLAGNAVPRLVTPDGLDRALGKGWTEVDRDTLGEVGVRAWLATLGVDDVTAGLVADGWGGDTLVLLEHPDAPDVGGWVSTWDTVDDAIQLIQALDGVAAVVAGDWTVVRKGPTVAVTFDLRGPARQHVLRALLRSDLTSLTSLDQVSRPLPDPRPPWPDAP